MMTHAQFLAHVRSLAEESGLSRAEIARRIGARYQHVTRALNQGTTKDRSTLLAIAQELAGESWSVESVYRQA